MNHGKLKSWLLASGMLLAATVLAGCKAQGDGSAFNDGPGTPGSPTDVTNCQVPLGSTLCILGGDKHDGGLVDVLLDENGPLGPIAGAIDTSELTTALTELLENDQTLASLVQGLIMDGQLQEGLELLIRGENGTGLDGLAAILQGVLAPNDQGQGLIALFGLDGIQGLAMALLVDGTSSDCQAPLGTLCLIAGENSDETGLVDLLLTSDGLIGGLSPTLSSGVTDDVVALLGDLLASNGSLPDLLNGLTAEGQLATALQTLLVGNPAEGVTSGLVQALDNLLGGLGDTVDDLVDYLRGLLGAP